MNYSKVKRVIIDDNSIISKIESVQKDIGE